jgi:hypothetical protein
MKKIFTLISMALVAMSVNAQDDTPKGDPGIYPIKSITMGDIKWENKNNKEDINDEAGTKLYFVVGQGNAYKDIAAEYYQSSGDSGDGKYYTRPYYYYVYYWQGITGVPSYGLYYKFTPKVSGKLKVQVWANKGNRATTVVPESTGTPLVMHTDYLVEGYINGQKVKEADGETNAKNAEGKEMMKFLTNEDIKKLHEGRENPWGALTEPNTAGDMPDKWNFVIGDGNQHFWGWLTFDVTAGESYYVFQASSQLGFGGYEFTPSGGETEKYAAAYVKEGSIVLSDEFSSVVDANGVATNVVDGNSIVKFSTTNMEVEAVGSGTPTSVEADFEGTGINIIKAAEQKDVNAPIFNLAGQKVEKSQKGILIQNGKKFVNK